MPCPYSQCYRVLLCVDNGSRATKSTILSALNLGPPYFKVESNIKSVVPAQCSMFAYSITMAVLMLLCGGPLH